MILGLFSLHQHGCSGHGRLCGPVHLRPVGAGLQHGGCPRPLHHVPLLELGVPGNYILMRKISTVFNFQSRFLEASLVQQADGELKKIGKKIYQHVGCPRLLHHVPLLELGVPANFIFQFLQKVP